MPNKQEADALDRYMGEHFEGFGDPDEVPEKTDEGERAALDAFARSNFPPPD